MSVLMMKCKHGICIEDTKGYVLSALGDISMFPIKCPMHFDGCNGHIDAYIAQRVLNEQQYCRFIEFSDRATYGDGKRFTSDGYCSSTSFLRYEMHLLSELCLFPK